ncbi:unnamed protein product [Schistosoma mattheei]|uniref:Uncharacterized protein n=1 Tax=Schistosoma mattheei TaxID=31246 RepID=A0A183PXJ0_9TREM|nr:unnamed protein product [Schistosoma mattheei]
MLYEMKVHELRSRMAFILSCRQECIKIICLVTENDIPVLLTDEVGYLCFSVYVTDFFPLTTNECGIVDCSNDINKLNIS